MVIHNFDVQFFLSGGDWDGEGKSSHVGLWLVLKDTQDIGLSRVVSGAICAGFADQEVGLVLGFGIGTEKQTLAL